MSRTLIIISIVLSALALTIASICLAIILQMSDISLIAEKIEKTKDIISSLEHKISQVENELQILKKLYAEILEKYKERELVKVGKELSLEYINQILSKIKMPRENYIGEYTVDKIFITDNGRQSLVQNYRNYSKSIVFISIIFH